MSSIPQANSRPPRNVRPKTWSAVVFIAILLAGIALRLSCGQDIEYKYDENWMFDQARQAAATGILPELGMPSGVGLRNPGMSVWIFVALTKLFGVTDPVRLARSVELMNCAALALLAWFAWKRAKGADRDAWFWGAALAAVNPMALVLQRKIWAQSTLPLLSTCFLMGAWWSETALGAFVLGFVGTLLGQIHMSGFFYLAAFIGWLAFARRDRWRWGWTFIGILVGIPTMWPWIKMVLAGGEGHSPLVFHNLRDLQFFKLWITSTLAIDLKYSLGEHRWDYLSFPIIYGTRTWIAMACWIVSMACGGFIILRSAYWRIKRFVAQKRSSHDSKTGMLLRSGFWCYGLIMTIAPFQLHQHYLLVAFPLPFLWLARSGLRPVSIAHAGLGRALLGAVVISQLLLSMIFLDYIHERGGAPGADYGVAYSAQHPPQ